MLAAGGSVFLDEIGDMNHYAQAKILRSLECKEVFPLGGNRALPINVRIIAATNHNPEQLMAGGAVFAKTFTTVSTSHGFICRRCGRERKTFPI